MELGERDAPGLTQAVVWKGKRLGRRERQTESRESRPRDVTNTLLAVPLSFIVFVVSLKLFLTPGR